MTYLPSLIFLHEREGERAGLCYKNSQHYITLNMPYHNIDDSEVLLQPMTYKYNTPVNEVEKLQVASFESGKVFGAH